MLLKIDVVLFVLAAPPAASVAATFFKIAAATPAGTRWARSTARLIISSAAGCPASSASSAAPRRCVPPRRPRRLPRPLHRSLAPVRPLRRPDPPRAQTHIIFAIVLVPPDFKTHLDALPGAKPLQQGHFVLHKFHFDILWIPVIPRSDDKLALRKAAAKRHDVHDDLNGPFYFVSHCDYFCVRVSLLPRCIIRLSPARWQSTSYVRSKNFRRPPAQDSALLPAPARATV